MVKHLNPEGVERRKYDLQRHRGQMEVEGPNLIWSMDAYLKFWEVDIEIYAAIDAYSRYVPWIYCGVSGRTGVSVLKQYLDVISQTGFYPRFLRSDRGTETMMCANAHFQLALQEDPTIQLRDCFMYGTSTANQRIESWWGQLSKGQLILWRVSSLLKFKD